MTSTTSSNESESTGAGLTNGGSATTTATKAPNPTDNSDRLTSIDESVPSLASCDSTSTNTDQQAPIIPLPNDELDLLVKLERANKEMETNHRSAQSILSSATTNGNTTNNSSPPSHSLSRRASFTSCEVNSLNNDEGEPSDKFEISIKHIGSFLAEKKSEFLNKISPIGDKEIEEEDEGKTDEVSWELWNQIIADWSTWSKKKPSQLREYIRRGIPIYLRPLAWQYLCGAHLTDAKDKYKEYLKKSSSCEKLIRRDVDRTYPESELFRTAVGQESLFNVMKAYSIHDPEVGYCQGSAFICGLLLIQNVPEEEAFAIFVQIMQHYNLREIYKPNMYHLGLCMFQLDSLLQEFLPDLHRHFVTHAFHPSMYCSSWFLTLFTTSLPLPLVCRIFDIFLNEGFEIIFRVGLAILDFHKDILITLDMEGMLKYFQKELPPKHETDHDTILNKAFAIKYNQRKMKKLEKDFSILKKEEQEEQVEMRRLRAENKLLKQRIDNLEKESAQLAERLIKGQVVNAQNAESIYVLKNENQKLKEKINELQLECEHSNELRRKQMSEHSLSSSERDALNERVNVLLEENNRLRDKPENARLEEELLSVKMREAEAQLAIKELQKTIHVLNLEYQEFLNNRQAFIISSPSSQAISVTNGNSTVSTSSTTATTYSSSSNGANGGNNNNGASQPGANDSVSSSNSSVVVVNKTQIGGMQYQQLEEELLKIKLREAEALSEMKSLNLKLMQLDTEKQVAYNQIKRQDEEIRKLNQQISHILEKELDQKSQLVELRRQLDDKDALLKELNMTHKLQEAEDAHLIAELRQRVASLEVNIQELETTGQLNQHDLAYLATSTDNLVLASPTSTTAPTLDRRSSFKIISRQMRNNSTNIMPVGYNTNMSAVGGASSNRYDDDSASSSGGGMNNSLSLSSIPSATAAATVTTTSSVNAMTNHVELNGEKKSAINRSYSIDSGGVKLQLGNHQNHEPLQPLKSTKTKQQHQESNNSAENSVAAKINSKEAVKAEYLHNENDEDKLNESQKSTTSSSSTNDTSNTSDSTNAINNTNNSTAIATNEEAN